MVKWRVLYRSFRRHKFIYIKTRRWKTKKHLKRQKIYSKHYKLIEAASYLLKKKIDNRPLKKIKKSKYEKHSLLLKLTWLTSSNFNDKERTITRANYVEKREIDRSTLYSFDRPFQVINADVWNSAFLGKGNSNLIFFIIGWSFIFEDLCLPHAQQKTNTSKNEIVLRWSKGKKEKTNRLGYKLKTIFNK